MGSCSSDDGGGNHNNPPAGELRLFAADTAKVITVDENGANEAILFDKTVNQNSYINYLSVKPGGAKLAFVENQTEGAFPNLVYKKELRVGKSDGTGDIVLFTNPNNETGYHYVRYCSDGKVAFITGDMSSKKLHVINDDGTGDVTMDFPYDVMDISDDRAFYVWLTGTSGNFTVQILDADGDAGLPGSYHNEDFDTADDVGKASFTADGAYCVMPYREGGAIKARVVNMAEKTSETFTLVSGLNTSSWMTYRLNVGSDAKRAVLTLSGEDFPKSKSYVIDTEAQTVGAPFENNDDNIYDVYPN